MTLTASDVVLSISGQSILKKVSLTVSPGRVTALIGPNGSGKSTLLRCLSGESQPRDGSVTLEGCDLDQIRAPLLAQKRSVMSQSGTMAFDFEVEQVLAMGWVQDSMSCAHFMADAMGVAIANCDIQHLLGRNFRSLSGGEQQRVSFARALVQIWRPSNSSETRYLLLDEPTASLDVAHELKILRSLRSDAMRQVGVLVVMHDLNLASHFADDICMLRDGIVEKFGSPQEVLKSDRLTAVYETEIQVEYHKSLQRLVVHTH